MSKIHAARDQIKKIMDENDLAGNVILCDGQEVAYMNVLERPWNVITIKEADNDGLEIRVKTTHLSDENEKKLKLEQTINLLDGCREMNAKFFSASDQLLTMLQNSGKIEWDVHRGPDRG